MKYMLYLPAVLAGSAIGYYFGSISGSSGWDLLYEIFNGVALGYFVIFAFEKKEYGSLLGAILGLMVALSLDWVAGSPVDMRNKLSFAAACAFVGWLFWPFWKQVLVGGFIGGVIGFVWGLTDSHWFGKVCLAPGVLNASLLAVQIFMLGMCFGSLYMKFFGWQFMKNRSQA